MRQYPSSVLIHHVIPVLRLEPSMHLQADVGSSDKTIEGLRLAIVKQGAKVRITPAAAFKSPELSLLLAMKQNLEILMTNRSINPAQGAPE